MPNYKFFDVVSPIIFPRSSGTIIESHLFSIINRYNLSLTDFYIDENILIVNPDNGWIQNCNSTPFSAAGINSPKRDAYPNYMTSFPENYRGIHAIALLEQTQDLTLDKLIDLAYDPYLPGAEALIKGQFDKADASGILDELAESLDTKVSESRLKYTGEDSWVTII